ncbi:MAG TPA: acyl carrier protein [Candidatus Acidoferrum sp.]|nr:acyl carrier protein [Candidatus Acidoferrum sp.]
MSQNQPNLESEIRKFITENMLFSADGFNYNDTDSLLDAGIVDSIGVMELVTFVGQSYKITVPPEDISPDNFDSIARLAGYIRRRQGAGPA